MQEYVGLSLWKTTRVFTDIWPVYLVRASDALYIFYISDDVHTQYYLNQSNHAQNFTAGQLNAAELMWRSHT